MFCSRVTTASGFFLNVTSVKQPDDQQSGLNRSERSFRARLGCHRTRLPVLIFVLRSPSILRHRWSGGGNLFGLFSSVLGLQGSAVCTRAGGGTVCCSACCHGRHFLSPYSVTGWGVRMAVCTLFISISHSHCHYVTRSTNPPSSSLRPDI